MTRSLILVGSAQPFPEEALALALPPKSILDFGGNLTLTSSPIIRTLEDYRRSFSDDVIYRDLAKSCFQAVCEIISALDDANVATYRGISLPACLATQLIQRYISPLWQQYYWMTKVLEEEQPTELWLCAQLGEPSLAFKPRGHSSTAWFNCDNSWEQAAALAAARMGVPCRYFGSTWKKYLRTLLAAHLGPRIVAGYKRTRQILEGFSTQTKGQASRDAPLIMALIRSPVHKLRLYPVMTLLREHGINVLEVQDMTLAVGAYGNKHEWQPTLSFKQWQTRLPIQKLDLTAARQGIRRIIPDCGTSCEGLSRNRWLRDHLLVLTHQYPEVATCIDGAFELLRAWKPCLVLLAYDQDSRGKAFARLCRSMDIPSLTVQHGFMHDPPLGYVPVETDKYAVMGQRAKDLLTAYATPNDVIEVTGVPGLDRKLEALTLTASEQSSAARVVTLIAEPVGIMPQQLIDLFFQAALSLPEISFVVKTYPREDPARYERIMLNTPNVQVISNQSVSEILTRSSVVVGVNSTALLEAMQLRLPVVVFRTVGGKVRNSFADYACTFGPGDNLSGLLRELLHDKDLRETIIQRQVAFLSYQAVDDGAAAERIADLVHRMIAK